jgi:hypothetical protein
MPFELNNVVPWGRSFEEYVAMFALENGELNRRILGCGDGPAAFNAAASRRGHKVISADPLYRFSEAEIRVRIEETAGTIAEQTRRNAGEFVWTHFRSVDELIETRLNAMRGFLADFAEGKQVGRYVDAALPNLPFADGSFDIALCSHFLFLYSEQHDLQFHVDSIVELRRVSLEVRIFSLLELGSAPSRHLGAVTEELARLGYRAERVRVAYEFQKNGNEMLRVV